MNNDNVEFMRAMWNMHPFGSSMPQFLRLPPRIANPLVPGHRGYSEGDLAEDATAKIKGFRDAYYAVCISSYGFLFSNLDNRHCLDWFISIMSFYSVEPFHVQMN